MAKKATGDREEIQRKQLERLTGALAAAKGGEGEREARKKLKRAQRKARRLAAVAAKRSGAAKGKAESA